MYNYQLWNNYSSSNNTSNITSHTGAIMQHGIIRSWHNTWHNAMAEALRGLTLRLRALKRQPSDYPILVVHGNMWQHVASYDNMWQHVCINKCIYIYICIHMYMCVYTYIYIYVYISIYTYIHILSYIKHMYVHICAHFKQHGNMY